MAQTGYTPILLYSSSTGGNTPAAGDLTNSTLGSELAINIADGKLFYKDSGGSVQVIGWKTVPTTAGGTGLTSYTAGDLLYYVSGTTLSKLGIGTNGQILKSTGSAPAWENVSALAVTSISFGTTGLTPNSATQGAVTVAGTLVAANGGTGQSSYTIGDILYASGATTLSKLADVATGNALISGGVGVAPSWGKVGLTTHVSGTLGVGNGGTGTATTFTAGSVLFAGASGVYSQNNAQFFWDNTNNRLALGQASASYQLDVLSALTGTTAGSNAIASLSSNASGRDAHLRLNDNSSAAVRYGQLSGAAYIWTNGAARLWIDTSGNVLINRTSQFTNEKFGVLQDADGKGFQIRSTSASLTNTIIQGNAVRNTTDGTFYAYGYYNDTAGYYKFYVRDAGDIYSTSTSITAISDQRFKENIRDLDCGLEQLTQLRPRRFDWKEGEGTGRKDVVGFIAQETKIVVPDVIDVWKRNPEDTEEYLGIRMTDLIPMMVKSIQELKKQVDDLKAQLPT